MRTDTALVDMEEHPTISFSWIQRAFLTPALYDAVTRKALVYICSFRVQPA